MKLQSKEKEKTKGRDRKDFSMCRCGHNKENHSKTHGNCFKVIVIRGSKYKCVCTEFTKPTSDEEKRIWLFR